MRLLLATLLLLLALPALAADWYVDNTASGANNGTSWTDAWQDTTTINWGSISAGDTVWISGGASGQSYSAFNTITASGTSGNYITIQAATEGGRSNIVTIGTSFVVSGNYIKFEGNGYKLVSGTTYQCGIVFTCNNRTTAVTGKDGGGSVCVSGELPWFSYCYFNGTYAQGTSGNSFVVRNTTGFVTDHCWWYQSVGQDQITWVADADGAALNMTNCLFQNNYYAPLNSHRDIANLDVGNGGYSLYLVNCIYWLDAGIPPQGDGFLFQTEYYSPAADLVNVWAINCVNYRGRRFIANGSSNGGMGDQRVIHCTAYDTDDYSDNLGMQFNYVGTNNLPQTMSADFINPTKPLGNDGIPFTADDGFQIGEGSAARDAGVVTDVTFDAANDSRDGTPDLGA